MTSLSEKRLLDTLREMSDIALLNWLLKIAILALRSRLQNVKDDIPRHDEEL